MELSQFVSFIVAWTASVIALVVAWMTNRKHRLERAFLNIEAVRSTATGGVEVEVANDGGRPALDIEIRTTDGAAAGRDGLRPDRSCNMHLAGQAVQDFTFTLSFSDADGRRRAEERRVVARPGGSLSVVPREEKARLRRFRARR